MMKQQNIFKKIGNILTELNEQYQFIAQNPEQLNELEVELLLANAHFLSDHVEILKKLNTLNTEVKTDPPLNVVEDIEAVPFVENEPSVEFEVEQAVEEEVELATIAMAEEEEERIDIKPEQEIVDEEHIHEETAERVLKYDFFKPDNDDHTFEFDLGKSLKSDIDKFDYEEKSVEEIFDRRLSKEEEEVLAKKKNALNQKPVIETFVEKVEIFEEDEIGPEPFLIPNKVPEVVVEEEKIENEPAFEKYNPKYDEDVISPPVSNEMPKNVPNSVPLKPVVESNSKLASPSFNDLLAKTNAQKNEVKAPIGDLKQGINLNEKLLFIKDLFNGYNLAYSEAIDLVNKMTSFETADAFLQSNYAVKNNWASKQSTVDQFYELLNRRFS